MFAFFTNREVFGGPIITKHIVLIYIQFIFENYQIATSLGYTYRRHKKCQQFQ